MRRLLRRFPPRSDEKRRHSRQRTLAVIPVTLALLPAFRLRLAIPPANTSIPGFTKKYNTHKLVYFEVFGDAYSAITREKQIKAGSRQKKMDLIHSMNPTWMDLYDEL